MISNMKNDAHVGHASTCPSGRHRMSSFPRVYGSFAEFERDELRRLDSLHTSVSDLVEERFAEELDFGTSDGAPRRRGRPRKGAR